MAILDTLIIQLGLDSSGLAQGAAQAHQNLTTLEQHANNTAQTLAQTGQQGADAFRTFRQEAMGALALFTGGRSLSTFGQDITHATQALSTLGQQLTATPPQLNTLQQALAPLSQHPTSSLEDTPLTPHTPQDHTHTATSQTPTSPIPSPLTHTSPSPNRAVQEWANLLSRANQLTRQALQEVEPTLHNAEQALARLHQRKQHPNADAPANNPLAMVQDLSALLTTRTILATHTPPHSPPSRTAEPPFYTPPAAKPHTPNAPQPDLTTRTAAASQATNTPLTPASPPYHPTPSFNPNPPASPHLSERDETSTHWVRLTHALTQASAALAQHHLPQQHSNTTPPQLSNTHAITQIVQAMDTAQPRHTTTHNNTTHSPTINITVKANSQHPAEIARAVEASIAKTITRYTLAHIS
ncbi:hypothetical protein [Bombella sp. ESL0385]|uniref:hypothetical protein n=1 Tax=Bombella sp. ESL0385 TaxID=2676446 RepID=UPI0012D8E639|nr:hypothetical protein [Bombella sp. ESL0385]MUG89669.1 hypothetical protein [Bombella sp. ESL0385]